MKRRSIAVLATADWHAPVWTNKQYIAAALAQESDVTYVESLGLRRPRISRSDARRIVARAAPPLEKSRETLPGALSVLRPRVLPFHGQRLVDVLNRHLIQRLDVDLLWTFSPITCGLGDGAPIVYHAVDLLHAFPRMPKQAILDAEKRLAARGCVAIASSRTVAAHLKAQGFQDVRLWENVANVELFVGAASRGQRISNRVVFGGNLADAKVDWRLLDAVVALKDVELVLAGPADVGGSGCSGLKRLVANGAVYTGTLEPTELAKLFASASVGLVPYLQNDYTAGVFPMKIFEYLGAGIPVVTTPLPSIPPDLVAAQCVEVAAGYDAFASSVSRLIRSTQPSDRSRCQELARPRSWTSRSEEARALAVELSQ